MQTGYFFICNSRIGSEKFNWNGHGIVYHYLDCEKCKKIAKNL